MNYPTVSDVKKLGNNVAISGLVGRIDKVFSRRNVAGGKTVQDMMLKDATGEIKITAWGHDDCGVYEGKEVIIQQGPKGGLTVKEDNYKNVLTILVSMSAGCTFQLVQVHRAMTGQAPADAPKAAAPAPTTTTIRGDKVGMAIKAAVDFMAAQTEEFNSARLHYLAGEIIKVSNKLEQGEFLEGKVQPDESVPF